MAVALSLLVPGSASALPPVYVDFAPSRSGEAICDQLTTVTVTHPRSVRPAKVGSSFGWRVGSSVTNDRGIPVAVIAATEPVRDAKGDLGIQWTLQGAYEACDDPARHTSSTSRSGSGSRQSRAPLAWSAGTATAASTPSGSGSSHASVCSTATRHTPARSRCARCDGAAGAVGRPAAEASSSTTWATARQQGSASTGRSHNYGGVYVYTRIRGVVGRGCAPGSGCGLGKRTRFDTQTG